MPTLPENDGIRSFSRFEPGGLLHPVPQALRVGAGGAGELAPERLRRRGDAQVGGGAGRQARGEVGGRHQRLEGGDELVAGQVPELREHAHLNQLAVLRLVVDREGGDAQLVGEPRVRVRIRRARVEDGVPRADVAARGGEPFVAVQSLLRIGGHHARQRKRRIGAAGEPEVEIARALQHAHLLARGVLAEQDGGAVPELPVAKLEGAASVRAHGARRREQPPGGGEGLGIVVGPDGEDEGLGILRHGEEGDSLVGIEAVGIGCLGVEHVEPRPLADRGGHLVEEGAERELRGHVAVHGEPFPRRGHHQRGADLRRHRHLHGAAQDGDVGAGGAGLAVLVLDGLHHRIDAGAREDVVHRRPLLVGRAVAEGPGDLRTLRHLLRVAETHHET